MIEINLSKIDQSIIRQVLGETYAGYAGSFLPKFLNTPKSKLETLWGYFENPSDADSSFKLSEQDWRIIYEAINAVIYELGPEELQTITGFYLNEFLNTGRIIYAKVYNRSNPRKW